MEPAELVQEGAQLLRSVSGISKPLNSTDEGECRLMYVDSTSACASPQRILNGNTIRAPKTSCSIHIQVPLHLEYLRLLCSTI
jgi:hypothetical protein